MKSTGTFQGFTALGWLGIAGVQHFYLGNPIRGLVWLFTFGLFFVGTVFDHATGSQQVARANRGRVPYPNPYPMPIHQPPPPAPAQRSSEVIVNLVAQEGASSVTAEQIKAIAGGGLASALRELDKLRYDRLIDDAEFAALKSKLLRDYS